MGYEIYDGLEVDTVENNFDALNTPEAHPSRDPRDTFYLGDDDGPPQLHVPVADPGDGDGSRPSTSPRSVASTAATPSTRRTRRSSTR